MRADGLLGASFLVGVGSGIAPVVSIEAYLLAVALIAPPETLVAALLLTTAGHMVAKCLLYLSGSGAARLSFLRRGTKGLQELRGRLERRPAGTTAVVFASATTGFPPFYLVSLAAGSIRWPLGRFLLVGGFGRLLRFAAVVLLPRLFSPGAP
jgi:membrane protein YqaA with SNARE-associated domain